MTAERRLRRSLALDAAASAVTSGVVLAAAGPVADRLDVPTAAVLVAVVAMADWTLLTGWLSRAGTSTVARFAPWVAAGNAAWVVASIALLAAGVVDRGSWWLIAPTSFAIGELAVAQWVFSRPLRRTAPPVTAVAMAA